MNTILPPNSKSPEYGVLHQKAYENMHLLLQFDLIRFLHQELSLSTGEDEVKKVIQSLVIHFGGTQIYIPSFKRVLREFRDKEMFQEFSGGNVAQLATKYHVSNTTVYKAIARVRSQKQIQKTLKQREEQ